jgi:hypothetical protein
VLQPNIGSGENNDEVQQWIEKYRRERLDKTPAKNPTPSVIDTPVSPPQFALDFGVRTPTDILAHELCKRSRTKRGLVSELEQENLSHIIPAKILSAPGSPMRQGLSLIKPSTVRRTLGDITPKKDNNILPPEPLDFQCNNQVLIPSSPLKSLKPKKRWLKTVVQEQKRQAIVVPAAHHDEENLAMPIRWNENEALSIPLIRRGGNSSPVNWSVVSALVDLGQQEVNRSSMMQPLNLSTSANRRS